MMCELPEVRAEGLNFTQLFVNGKHVPYVVPEKTRKNAEGDIIEAFELKEEAATL